MLLSCETNKVAIETTFSIRKGSPVSAGLINRGKFYIIYFNSDELINTI